jgi:hypothetical protein
VLTTRSGRRWPADAARCGINSAGGRVLYRGRIVFGSYT